MADSFVERRDDSDTATDASHSLRAWHAAHSAWLHAFLCRALRLQPSDADDIVQDTWLTGRILLIPQGSRLIGQ